jgi:hypothetical protein
MATDCRECVATTMSIDNATTVLVSQFGGHRTAVPLPLEVRNGLGEKSICVGTNPNCLVPFWRRIRRVAFCQRGQNGVEYGPRFQEAERLSVWRR